MALRTAVEMKNAFSEYAPEPIQNSGTQSKETLIGHRRREETTQLLGALSGNELCSARSVSQEACHGTCDRAGEPILCCFSEKKEASPLEVCDL